MTRTVASSPMADRPQGSGGAREGNPRVRLALREPSARAPPSDATQRVEAQQPQGGRPDETRVMPVARREARGSGGPAARPALVRRRRPRRRGRSRRERGRRLGSASASSRSSVLLLVFLLARPALTTGRRSTRSTRRPTATAPTTSPAPTTSSSAPTRPTTSPTSSARRCSTGERGGTNTDTIIVLHTGSGADTLMSIPRDTLVEVPGGGTQMINAAFASGGPPLLVQRVEALTGIHIDHYVELGFGSVINTVDAFGGVEICPKQDMKDPHGATRHQEGLPGGRRPDRAGVLALAPRRRRSATSTASPASARSSARSATRRSRRGRSSTPCATGRSTTPRPARSASTRT